MENLPKKKDNKLFQSNAISRSIYSCTPIARKLIAYTLKCFLDYAEEKNITAENLKNAEIKFQIPDFLKALEMLKGGKTYSVVKNAVQECFHASITLVDEEKHFLAINWFTTSEYDENKGFINMKLNPDIAQNLLLYKETQYSLINLKVIGALKSIYAIRFYEIALSYRNMKGKYKNKLGKWTFTYSIDELKLILGAEGKRTNNFLDRNVRQPIEELNKINTEFSISIEIVKELNKAKKIVFTCQENIQKVIAPSKTEKPSKADKELEEVNKEREELEALKTAHLTEYYTMFVEELSKLDSALPNNMKESMANINTLERLREKYC